MYSSTAYWYRPHHAEFKLLAEATSVAVAVEIIRLIWARGYKTFSMLNSTEYEIFPAHKC